MHSATSMRVRHLFLVAAFLLLAAPSLLLAQTATGRVKADHVSVWNPGFSTVATTVNIGTTLEIVGQQGNWYEVILPGPEWQPRQTGFIAKSRVDLVSGTPPASTASPRRQARSQAPAARGRARSSSRVFAEAGYGRFTAKQTFDAVLGTPGGPWYGGGVLHQRASGLFVQGEVEFFSATGERVFVNNGTVFPLGLTDTVTIMPVMGSVGMRKAYGRRGLAFYVGAGAGVYLLRETSEFSDPADDVKQTDVAYRGLAGLEFPLSRAVAAALEVKYTAVPNSLTGATAEAFDEHDLGGVQVQVKLLFGRR